MPREHEPRIPLPNESEDDSEQESTDPALEEKLKEIRKDWTPEEEQRRRLAAPDQPGYKRKLSGWTPPEVKLGPDSKKKRLPGNSAEDEPSESKDAA